MQFDVKIDGEGMDGRIPVHLLNKVLHHFQQSIYHIGEYQLGDGVIHRERGPFPRKIIEECTLHLVAISEGSFVASLAPGKEDSDIGKTSISTLFRLLEHLTNQDQTAVKNEIKFPGVRSKILKNIQSILPRHDEYNIALTSSDFRNRSIPLSNKISSHIDEIINPIKKLTKTVAGRIVEVKVHPENSFGILHDQRIIRAYGFENHFREILESVGGEVLIKGDAIQNEYGRITELTSVSDLQIATPGEWHFDYLETDDRIFEFSEPLIVHLDYEYDCWTGWNELLDIHLCEPTFEELLSELSLQVSFLWDEYGQEEDERLTGDAIILKQKVLNIIDRVVTQK